MKNIYPSLLESGNIITSNSWFDIKEHKNHSYNRRKKKEYKVDGDGFSNSPGKGKRRRNK